MITRNGRCAAKIRNRIIMGKVVFEKVGRWLTARSELTRTANFSLRKIFAESFV